MVCTGFRAFIALCIPPEKPRQRNAFRLLAVSATRFSPLNHTSPAVTEAGGFSNCAMPNSIVDLPQPDSPTTPRNSPLASFRSTSATADTDPEDVAYSTRSPLTSSRAPGSIGSGIRSLTSHSAADGGRPRPEPFRELLGTLPPHRPQSRVADLVEGVVHQGERDAQRRDAERRGDGPPPGAVLQSGLRVGPVEHRPPAVRVRVAEPQELQAGGVQHREQRGAQEVGDDQ